MINCNFEQKAREFCANFKTNLLLSVNGDEDMLKQLYWNGGGVFTDEIKKIIDKSMTALVFEKEQVYGHELFRLDYYSYIGTMQLRPKGAESHALNNRCWQLNMAIEHENDSADWLDEFYKLINVVANLKILICYYNYDKNDINAALKFAVDGVDLLDDCFKSNFLNSNYLILVGQSQWGNEGKKSFDKYRSIPSGYKAFYKEAGSSEFTEKDW